MLTHWFQYGKWNKISSLYGILLLLKHLNLQLKVKKKKKEQTKQFTVVLKMLYSVYSLINALSQLGPCEVALSKMHTALF